MTQDLHCSRGPVSSMPGSSHDFPQGEACDEHSDRPAVARIQGETDSMGCEYLLVCEECRDSVKVGKLMGEEGRCDRCHEIATPVQEELDTEWLSTQAESPRSLFGLVLWTDGTKDPAVRLFSSIPWGNPDGHYKRIAYNGGVTLRRDPDEGSAGPVYRYCGPCKTIIHERELAEVQEYWDDQCDDDYDYGDSGED